MSVIARIVRMHIASDLDGTKYPTVVLEPEMNGTWLARVGVANPKGTLTSEPLGTPEAALASLESALLERLATLAAKPGAELAKVHEAMK